MTEPDSLIIRPSMFKLPEVKEQVAAFFNIRHFYMFHELVKGSKIVSFGPFKRFDYRAAESDATALGGMIGAPLAAIALENAIASGAKHVLAFGTAGWLNPDKRETGELIVAEKGVDETGMVQDYGRSDAVVELNRRFSTAVCRAVVSVNSFYRLSVEKVKEYRRRQIDLIDMEAAPLSHIASVSDASYWPLFVISDRVTEDFKWRYGSIKEKEKFLKGLKKGLELLSSFDPS